MGLLSGDETRAGKKSKKGKWSLKSLFASNLRSKTLPRELSEPAPGQSTPSSPQAAAPVAGTSPLPATPSAARQPASPAAAASPAASPAAGVAGSSEEDLGLAGRGLVVQVIQARRLRAADSNGLSDPYVIVKVGDTKASSKTELKTLEPRWNESMCFAPGDVQDALEDGRPFISLRVFDWDLVSADDFLGQCEVPFADLDPRQQGPSQPTWLPLYGVGRGGKREDAGEVQVAIWFQAGGGAEGQDGDGAASTLCSPPGTRKHVPQVVHCHKGVLYEEPLIACLAVTLESVQGQLAVAGASAGASGARSGSSFDGSPTPRSSLQLAPASPSAALLADSKQHGKPKLLGRLFHRRRHSSNNSNGGNSSTLKPVSSNIDDKMVAGEDWGDEYGGLSFYEEHAAAHVAADSDDDEAPGADGSHSPRSPARRRLSSSDGGQPRLQQASSSPAGEAAVAAAAAAAAAAGESRLSGKRMYARLVLGSQKLTSFIKMEHLDGSVNWHQTFVFAVPLPLRDRQLRLELYRTSSNTQRGRLVSMAHVWLRDLLPPGIASNPEASKESSWELEGVLKHQVGGRVLLRSTLVDTDMRRCSYQQPYTEEGEGEGEEHGGVPTLQRLESTTEEYSRRELRRKALHTEESFVAWKASGHHRAGDAATGLLPMAASFAQQSLQLGWRRMSRLLSAQEEESSTADAAGVPAAAPPAPPLPLPQPAGSLLLTVASVSLLTTSQSDCFFVLKCGPFWGRSSPLAMTAGPTGNSEGSCGWQLSIPVLDPSCLLTLAVFHQPARGQRAPGQRRPGILYNNPMQVVGKLRVRLSCLRPNAALSADLPLLMERAKGAHKVGSVALTLQASYDSTKALVKGYTAPALPKAAYSHGLGDKSHQLVMARESRRIVLRWLERANPAIGALAAGTVLDTDRETFALSRTKVCLRRLKLCLAGVRRMKRGFDNIKSWQNPWHSLAAMAGVILFCFLPRLVVPALLAWLVQSTLAAQPENAGLPKRMQEDPPDIAEENESLETTAANPLANLRAKLDKLQRLGLMVQTVLDDVACAMERGGALLTWQDPTATGYVVVVLSAIAALISLLGFAPVVAFVMCFVIRPPQLRTPTPPLPAVFFSKLPTRGERIV